jgi:transposase
MIQRLYRIEALATTRTAAIQDRSVEFVEHLKALDSHYPEEATIRMILDNHNVHISKETRKYPASVPSWFEFVFTPTHGSWLNLIECFFSKMARTLLRGIRVES